MDTPRRPHRVSLFAKFTAVILLLGIVPIVLLVTVLQSRMLTEYRASLEEAYQDAIAYSAYSIRVRLDTYTDLSKFCYYYNYSSQGDFSYDYDNYDNLRKILSGEAFADADNAADSIRHEMGLFLHYMNMTDADIEASHFVYAPAGAAKVVSYQLGNYNNSLFDSEAYALSYGAVDYLLKPVKKDDLLRAVEKCLPVQPEHSAPASPSDTGSYSDAFGRVAEMEPTSYILTAVQPLGLTARNAMERQLIEFSIFGQLDTLCRQTGQGTAFQKKGQCYLLLVNMTQAQATGWLHDAQALLEQRTKCKVGFVCSPATAEMSAVPTFTAPCRDACRWFYFADRLPDTVLAMDAPPFGEAPADTAALHPLQEAVAAGFVETDREIFNRAVENLLAAVPPITDGRADAAVYHLLVCRRMVQARLERSGVQCAGGSNDLLDAARETADYPALEALFKKSLEELYGQMAGQVKKNEHKDIQKVTDYIAAHYRENLTLEVLAKHIHMNPFYFSSYFKKQLGQNFKDYLNRVRMEHALELLLNSDKRSYEIAEEVGFKDYRYFNEVFSRYYGKTPAAYRKSFKEQSNG